MVLVICLQLKFFMTVRFFVLSIANVRCKLNILFKIHNLLLIFFKLGISIGQILEKLSFFLDFIPIFQLPDASTKL